jgi:hypothetical protein
LTTSREKNLDKPLSDKKVRTADERKNFNGWENKCYVFPSSARTVSGGIDLLE